MGRGSTQINEMWNRRAVWRKGWTYERLIIPESEECSGDSTAGRKETGSVSGWAWGQTGEIPWKK